MRPALAVLAALAASAHADVRLPAIIGPNMVLQAETEAPIWGWADPGEEVVIVPGWPGAAPAHATAGPDGKWSASVTTPAPGGPYTITITGADTLTLDNVLVGEVWLASGQSNMEWPLRATDNAEGAIAAADHPEIRLFMVTNAIAPEPQEDCTGRWVVCSPETVADFSAVAYYFGRDLHEHLGAPVGLIASEWGGTPAEAWTSAESLAPFPRHAPGLDLMRILREDPDSLEREHQAALAAWKARLESDESLGWTSPDADDSAWKAMRQPENWSTPDLAAYDGAVWCRRTFEIPAAWEGRDLALELGPIDDNDTTYFNGTPVGATEGWTTPRRYTVPAKLVRAGRAVIAVNVVDNSGPGGMHGAPDGMFIAPKGDPESERIGLAGEWRYKLGRPASEMPPQPQKPTMTAHTPTSLYNGMIAPLVPYAIRGAIWYQGESNRGVAYEYRALFPAMITDWREKWGSEFPFYFVQIAPYTYGGDRGETAELREAQLMTLALPNTGMAVTMDIGNPRDIHPRNKLDVGRRLALWARARTYGQTGFEHSGPLFAGLEPRGDQLVLRFDHAEGLDSRGGVPRGFEIAGEDRVWHAAGAIIDGETVILSAYGVHSPVAARYGWDDDEEPNLFNGSGLPASPFRTDDWERVTQP